MPGRVLLTVALSVGIISGAAMLTPAERAAPVRGECVGKKRVIPGTARIKRTEARKRCHVFMPILM